MKIHGAISATQSLSCVRHCLVCQQNSTAILLLVYQGKGLSSSQEKTDCRISSSVLSLEATESILQLFPTGLTRIVSLRSKQPAVPFMQLPKMLVDCSRCLMMAQRQSSWLYSSFAQGCQGRKGKIQQLLIMEQSCPIPNISAYVQEKEHQKNWFQYKLKSLPFAVRTILTNFNSSGTELNIFPVLRETDCSLPISWV